MAESITERRYYAEAENWFDDTTGKQRTNTTRMFVITVLSISFGLFGLWSTVKGVWDKEYIPVVIEVDKTTGLVNIVRELSGKPMPASEAIDRHFISRFILAYETWDSTDIDDNYNLVNILSSKSVFNGYQSRLNTATNHYGATGQREIELLNISFLSDTGVVHVRFKSLATSEPGKPPAENYWVAVLGYRYNNVTMTDKKRLTNFQGFMVTSYRVDQELFK